MSILVETMRREGYEFQLGQPQVLIKEIDGIKHEPVELLTIQVPEPFSGKVIEIVTKRKGEIVNMENKNDRMHLEFSIPARGLIGMSNSILTVSEGEAISAHRFKAYEPWKGDIETRKKGSLITMHTGTAIPYAIDKLHSNTACLLIFLLVTSTYTLVIIPGFVNPVRMDIASLFLWLILIIWTCIYTYFVWLGRRVRE